MIVIVRKMNIGILSVFLIFLSLYHVEGAAGKSCDNINLEREPCPETQMCDFKSGTCQCRPGFKYHNDTYCEAKGTTHLPDSNTSSSLVSRHDNPVGGNESGKGSIVAGILIPLVLIAFVISAVYYVNRKYHMVAWVRQKFRQRNPNYDEFMIGQEDDDPPLH